MGQKFFSEFSKMKLSLSILALVSADARLRRESVIVGDDGKWNKCEAQLSDMDVNGEIKCEAEVCSVLCMPGFMVEGPAKAKCVKGKDGEWSFNKDLGVCVEGEDDMEDDMEDKPDKPDMEDHEDDEMDHEDKPEDYEDKPEEDDGDMYDDEEKPMCEEDEDCEEKPDGEKPDMEDMPDVFGDDGKWNKCEVEPIDMGKIKCEADKCMLYCMEGFMVEGNGKAKCEKNKNGIWKFNKEFGTCVECGDDCPEVEMPEMPEMPEKPEDEEEAGEAEGVSGDDGKWQKCEPEPVENGKITCMDVKCGLECEEGFMVEGNAKAKCEKNKKGIWKFNKPLGTCVDGEDKPEDDEEKPDDEEEENEEPVDEVENPGCKNLEDMIPEDSGLEIGCKVNGKQQFICKLECPEGTNFMGKDGKSGTKLTCKCKGDTCKWQNDAGKTVNGK